MLNLAIVREHPAISIAAVLDWSRERGAAYGYRRLVKFHEELPMSVTGEILKYEPPRTDTGAGQSVPA